MVTISVMIATPGGARILAHSLEREAALAGESILRNLELCALPTALWIQCADLAVALRLSGYLNGVQEEMIAT
ncbi:hypothetical protein DK389_28730 [Methylobacterium durans]|jgi:hypothetical protein|uniref:Uncharacterized protein n=1 Tax=Methylobacterium durans TaxID=2202825 RepID=A0A2U8WEQ7_9HYPH|nr:hypothetical protein DK389_28730 [Methylobacterium durans]